MKKRVVCVLCLALFLLIACTMISTKIEEEMLTQVVTYEVEPKAAGKYDINLPFWYLYFEDKTIDPTKVSIGTDFSSSELYQLEEGTGWESGLRIQPVKKDAYMPDPIAGAITSLDETRGWTFVAYASRFPEVGKLVEVAEKSLTEKDCYLAVYPNGIPEVWEMPKEVSILAQKDNALILDVEKGPKPFMEERARHMLKGYGTINSKIYSMNDIVQFLRMLPAVAIVVSVLISALIIWFQSLCLLNQDRENRWLLCINGLMGFAFLVILWYTLRKIDFPSSLLPVESILDQSHYAQEFSQIFGTLTQVRGSVFDSMMHFGRTGQLIINFALHMVTRTKQIIAMGICLPALWVSFPVIIKKIYMNRKAENGST